MRVFSTSTLMGQALERLADHCELDIWERSEPISCAGLRARLAHCEGLVCLLTNAVDEALVASCDSLRFVSSMSAGVDHVDVAALNQRRIPLGHTPGVLVDTTADLAFALLLGAARRIPEADNYVREGRWEPARPWYPDMLVGKDLAGATLGILGLGQIGRAVARRAVGFGMNIIGWTRSGRQVEGVASVGFDELLAQADFLSVNVALTSDTRNLLDAAAINRMKRGAVLVNTARGGIVDEAALARALADGRLFAAGIDVFGREPVAPDNPLLGQPNVVLAPHIGSATLATRTRMAQLAVDNAIAALQGKAMPHCFNPEVYGDN